ncbi:MAG: hypothetical protein LBQ16_03325 [Gracilibacteraceae bacterium]|nr:hypothetical protein [Gracilibacteraceae bacterium]
MKQNGKHKAEKKSLAALAKLQAALGGEAGALGLTAEDEIAALCRDVRKEAYGKKYENNA